jgi:hypothetical protein
MFLIHQDVVFVPLWQSREGIITAHMREWFIMKLGEQAEGHTDPIGGSCTTRIPVVDLIDTTMELVESMLYKDPLNFDASN